MFSNIFVICILWKYSSLSILIHTRPNRLFSHGRENKKKAKTKKIIEVKIDLFTECSLSVCLSLGFPRAKSSGFKKAVDHKMIFHFLLQGERSKKLSLSTRTHTRLFIHFIEFI